MLKQFENYLIQRGYKEFSANGSPSTVIDYSWRIAKIVEREGITEQHLVIGSERNGLKLTQTEDIELFKALIHTEKDNWIK